MSPIMWSQWQKMTNHPQFHHMGGVVVETLQDWWFIIGFTTLKPIIQRFQSFLLILIFPIYKWALDFTVFGRTAWGFVCNLRAGYHQWMSRDMNRDSQVNYQASLCLHCAGYIMSWSVDPGIQNPCHDRDSVRVPVCACGKKYPWFASRHAARGQEKSGTTTLFFGEWLIITSCEKNMLLNVIELIPSPKRIKDPQTRARFGTGSLHDVSLILENTDTDGTSNAKPTWPISSLSENRGYPQIAMKWSGNNEVLYHLNHLYLIPSTGIRGSRIAYFQVTLLVIWFSDDDWQAWRDLDLPMGSSGGTRAYEWTARWRGW